MKYLKPLFDFRSRKITYDSFLFGWLVCMSLDDLLRGLKELSPLYLGSALLMAAVAKYIHAKHPLK